MFLIAMVTSIFICILMHFLYLPIFALSFHVAKYLVNIITLHLKKLWWVFKHYIFLFLLI